jgi:hypothetical protein
MRAGSRTAKAVVWMIVFFCSVGVTTAGTQIYLFGKMTMGRPIGDSTDYEPGVSDFPMSESYTAKGFGLGFRSGRIFYLGLEGHYNMSGKMTLLDPSDNDSVEIDTYSSITGLVVLGINILKIRMLHVFIEGGGGMSYALNVESKTYTSENGFETQIEPPEKTTPIVFFGGAGIVLNFSRTAGFFVNGRYQITNADQKQTALVAGAGLIFSF